MKHCPNCNGKIVESKVRDHVYDTNLGNITIQGRSFLPRCVDCNNLFVTGKHMEGWNKLILKKLADKKRLLKPKELVFIFSVLPYHQKEIADTIGRDKTTLSKYKSGANPPDQAFDFFLKKIMVDYADGLDTTMREMQEAYESDGLSEETEITSVAAKSG